MKTIEGNIIDINAQTCIKGRVYYTDTIYNIEYDISIQSEQYIMPGLVDAHVHIESSMLTPLEYSKIALKHGVVAAVTDPHEIANVCGLEGIQYMVDNAKLSPMKINFGAPSCVPATSFESSGAVIGSSEIEQLLEKETCSHLSEMMNFPGVLFSDKEVLAKLNIAKKYNKRIDGHAPLLRGDDLKKYVDAGISTDHECTTIEEAKEKIQLGMKIMLRESSASRDFQNLLPLLNENADKVIFCTDDCHPDDLEKGYINLLVKRALLAGYSIFDVLTAATKTAIDHYKLKVGLLRIKDPSDFIVVDNLNDFNILKTIIDGVEVFNGESVIVIEENNDVINNFYQNDIVANDIRVRRTSDKLNVIQIIEDSLLTKKLQVETNTQKQLIESNIESDILKIVVLNRYQKALPSVGFIKGFQLQKGAIAGTIAHDSHNIVAVGTNDSDLLQAIRKVQDSQGGLVVVNGAETSLLALPLAGLMSDKCCLEVALKYQELSLIAQNLGCKLHAPFMTLAFMSLLVIPELKIGDKGLFDVNLFDFIELQN